MKCACTSAKTTFVLWTRGWFRHDKAMSDARPAAVTTAGGQSCSESPIKASGAQPSTLSLVKTPGRGAEGDSAREAERMMWARAFARLEVDELLS